jgi:hypothetical protein
LLVSREARAKKATQCGILHQFPQKSGISRFVREALRKIGQFCVPSVALWAWELPGSNTAKGGGKCPHEYHFSLPI